jgi:two-component system chemotaxis response regulator CheB
MDAVQGSPTSASEVAAAAEPLQSATRNIVVVGASAGGVKALRGLLSGLPANYGGSIFVVMHISPDSRSELPSILTRDSALPTVHAEDGMAIETGRVYVAPPDQHLLVEREHMLVVHGPRENRHRPAIDPLFRSAAQVYGPRVVGVVLTGSLDDGTAGLWAVKQLGGTAVVQDPEDALFPSMPRSALEHVNVDYCVPLAGIAPLLVDLTSAAVVEAEGPMDVPERLEIEVKIAKEDNAFADGIEGLGEPSVYACPECHGVLMQLQESNRIRFRCHTGHAYSAESLLADITEGAENSVWSAIRSLQESIMLMRHMSAHLESSGNSEAAAQFLERAEDDQRRADTLRSVVNAHLQETPDI